jgi:hypothetical protein
MLAALAGIISTRWTVAESLTGLSEDIFVNGRSGKIGPGNQLNMSWWCVPAGAGAWVLDTSALDVNTRLAV